jgi:hypothetical protein
MGLAQGLGSDLVPHIMIEFRPGLNDKNQMLYQPFMGIYFLQRFFTTANTD